MLHNYKHSGSIYSIFGKRKGKANQENKYELPPPIDTELFFGTLCVIKRSNDDDHISYEDVSLDEWNTVYESLFGGFEDLLTMTMKLDLWIAQYIQTKIIPKKVILKTDL